MATKGWDRAAKVTGGAKALKEVKLDGLTVLKIIKHCHDNASQEVTGSLVGLDNESTLEITNCFPFPHQSFDDDDDKEGDMYQMEMLKMLRDVNIDDNCVGWYQSKTSGASCTEKLVEAQIGYQMQLGMWGVVIVYNPLRTLRGDLALNAYRLSDKFMEAYKKHGDHFTQECMASLKLESSQILQEIPIKITNTPLNQALLYEWRKEETLKCRFERLDLSINPVLEKGLGDLVTCVAELTEEQAKFQRYEHNVTRQKQLRSNWLQERRLLNAQRKEEGQEPLPETDPNNQIFKQIPEPSRLPSLLVSKQIHTYCDQINRFSGSSFNKIFLAGSFHKDE